MLRRHRGFEVRTAAPWLIGAGLGAAALTGAALVWRRRHHAHDAPAPRRAVAPEAASARPTDMAGSTGTIDPEELVPDTDRILAEQILTSIEPYAKGRAFQVLVAEGEVEIFGSVEEHEADAMLLAIRSVPGVKELWSHLVIQPTGAPPPGIGS